MCGEDVSRIKWAISMVIAAKANGREEEKEEAMKHFVSVISDKLAQDGSIQELEDIIRGR